MNHAKIRRITMDGLICAVAISLGILESFIPQALPGIKPGLANICTLLALLLFSPGDALAIVLIRVVICQLWNGSIMALWYSLAGGLLSWSVMWLLLKIFKKSISPVALSVAGAVSHSVGQIIIAVTLVGSYILVYLPVLIASSIVTGLLVGLASGYAAKKLEKVVAGGD